ncbi:MAG: hypothetical protein ACKOCM_11245 [Cyanobacteriota bacterium]
MEHRKASVRRRAGPGASNRFLAPRSGHQGADRRPWSPSELFGEGSWQAIRVQLECRGWPLSQIEQIHALLRLGWSLALAEQQVAAMTGHCPRQARLLR